MLTFYDLVSKPNGGLWSPNTWKVRLALLHKAQHQSVQFQARDLTLSELRGEMVQKTGIERPRAPSLELDDGSFLFDSFLIAQYLDTTCPAGPPLIPDENSAYLIDVGFGNSDSGWSTMFELCAVAIADTMTETEREYFTSDYKLGFTDGWKKLTSLDQASMLARAKDSLLPFEALLSRPSTDFLASPTEPAFIDYVVFGRFAMIHYARPDLVGDLWKQGNLGKWVERMIERFDLSATMARTG